MAVLGVIFIMLGDLFWSLINEEVKYLMGLADAKDNEKASIR